MSGIPSVRWNSGDTIRRSPHGPFAFGAGVYPSTLKLPVDQFPPNGMFVVAPAPITPGTCARRGITAAQNCRLAVSVAYFAPGSERLNVNTFAGLKPGSTPASFAKLLISNPPPVSSASASATSATTSPRRTRCPLRSAAPVRPPSLSVLCKFARHDCNAGTIPNASPVTTAMPSVNATTVPSIASSFTRGRFVGLKATSARTVHHASSSPIAPPTSDNNRLSVSNCRMRSHGRAPSAVRIATSFCRAAARASSRFATLAQAIRRTKPTAPRSTNSAGRIVLVDTSPSGTSLSVQSGLNWFGNSFLRSSANAVMSRVACSVVMPGLMRAVSWRNSFV